MGINLDQNWFDDDISCFYFIDKKIKEIAFKLMLDNKRKICIT